MTRTGRWRWGDRGKRKWTLRRQLIALFIVFTVGPLLLTNAWGYLQSRRTFKKGELRHAHNVAELEATAVFRFVHEQYQLVAAVVAGNQDLFGLLRALATPDPQARRSVRHALRNHLIAKQQKSHSIEELYLLSPQGRLLVSTRATPTHSGDQRQSACFRRGLVVTSIDGVDWSEPSRPTLLISAPIHDTAGDFLGVLCTRSSIQLGVEPGETSLREPSQSSVYLLSTGGRIIARDTRVPNAAAPGARLPHVYPRWRFGKEAWEGAFGDSEHGVLSAYAPIAELDGGVLVEIPSRTALASLHSLMWEAAAFVLLITALGIAAAIGVARRLARPVAALSDAAKRAGSGALGVRVPPGGTVEVRDLARSFNQMSAALKESHDLLESRIAERTHALQVSQEFSERLLDSIDQPVVVIDRSLLVVKANQAALTRYGAGLVGQSCQASFACDGCSCSACQVRTTFDSGKPGSVERIERIGEAEDIVSLTTFAVRGREHEVEAVIQLRRVVTQERLLQAQIVHQEKMSAFGMVAAGVAHEIGNPLAAIQSQLALARAAPVPGRAEQTLRIVSDEVDRISRLLRELVSFVRRGDDEPTLVSLDQVARDVVRLIKHDPRAHDVQFDVRAGGDALAVRAKEDSLAQVLINLGLNALDAMPAGGTITFEAGREQNRAVLRARDTGCGVPESVRTHLFEPFYTSKGAGRGTGLGLFVSRGIVERMGGDLALEHTGPHGTVFRVSLPLATGWGEEVSP